jgi:hypothetical protein
VVGLEALEDLLRVVQDGGGRVHRDRGTRFDAGVVPALLVGVPDGDHVVGEYPPEPGVGHQRGPLVGRDRVVMTVDLKVDAHALLHGVL